MNDVELDWNLLEKLCSIHAVSGREDTMTSFVRDSIKDFVDELSVDNLGNVVGIIKGTKYPEFKLMLQAHMDEIGLIVRNITDDGFLLLERIGGMPEKSLLGQSMDILTEDGKIITGYIATKSHHVTSSDEKLKVPSIHEMFMDVGLRSFDDVSKAGIKVGDPITYHPNFRRFGEGMIVSKALDNRVGVFILLETLKYLFYNRPQCTVVFSFSVLEEFSIRGSIPTVNATKPDAIISLDITVASDTPYEKGLQAVVVGKGPAIKMMDFHGRGTLGGLFSSPKLRHFIEEVAAKESLPLQREVIVGVITDPAFQLYLGEKGNVIAGISIPQRYTHSPISMCNEFDIATTVKLMMATASSFSPAVDLSRGI